LLRLCVPRNDGVIVLFTENFYVMTEGRHFLAVDCRTPYNDRGGYPVLLNAKLYEINQNIGLLRRKWFAMMEGLLL
jgi:hypothetical protein